MAFGKVFSRDWHTGDMLYVAHDSNSVFAKCYWKQSECESDELDMLGLGRADAVREYLVGS